MVNLTKPDRKGQEIMTEADTPLSLAADEFLAAEADLKLIKSERESKMKDLIEIMREKKINRINHQGDILVVRKGHVTRDTVAHTSGS